MECLGVGLILLVVGMFLLIMATKKLQRKSERWNRSFAVVAKRFGGVWSPGGWFRNPSLRMQYGATHARLAAYRYGGNSGPWCVELVVHVPEPIDMRCEISQRTPQRWLARNTFGLAEVELDWTDFRYHWQVLTDDGDTAALLLSRAARLQIDQLWKLPFRSEVSISLFPNWLIVRKLWDSAKPLELESFVELALGFYDQTQLARTAGIEFVAGESVTVVSDAQCRICGEAMLREIVICRRCKTPHHFDCWEYAGGCATYGCRETQFQMPATPEPLASPGLTMHPPQRQVKPR